MSEKLAARSRTRKGPAVMDPFFTKDYKRRVRVSPYEKAYQDFCALPICERMRKMHAWAAQSGPLTPCERYIRGRSGHAFAKVPFRYARKLRAT